MPNHQVNGSSEQTTSKRGLKRKQSPTLEVNSVYKKSKLEGNLVKSYETFNEEEQLKIALERSKAEADLKAAEDKLEEEQLKLALKISCRECESTHLSKDSKSHFVMKNNEFAVNPMKENMDGQYSNLLSPNESSSKGPSTDGLRLIVVDGSNVGMNMGNEKKWMKRSNKWVPVFAPQALAIVHEYFSKKGHKVVIILPKSRWNNCSEKDREVLDTLERQKILAYTPSRRTLNKQWDPYDDRVIVEHASVNKGIIVTLDNYRDLIGESPEFKEQIEKRLLPFTFVGDIFYPAFDPLGKNGPKLDEFLRH